MSAVPVKHPQISLALPVYNGANYLHEALDSIRAQTFTDFEIVIADNASSDETPDICQEYARQDSRIKIKRSKAFLPQAENVNRAVDLCSGEWVKLFCHDDLMVPDCMVTVNQAISDCDSNIGLIGNGEQWLFANGYCHRISAHYDGLEHWKGRGLLRAQLSGRRPSQPPPLPSLTTATVRKHAWLTAGRFQSRFLHFDIFLWIQLLMDWDYIYIPKVLTTNRIHGAQVAVSARQSLRSVADNRLFWSEFVQKNGHRLDLMKWSQLLVRNRWLGTAGTAVALQLLRRDYSGAAATFFALPAAYWPLIPAFIVRSYHHEKQKVKSVVSHVPMNLLYPG
jgi:glycosyltransferase involved in cell wall biosynthesis